MENALDRRSGLLLDLLRLPLSLCLSLSSFLPRAALINPRVPVPLLSRDKFNASRGFIGFLVGFTRWNYALTSEISVGQVQQDPFDSFTVSSWFFGAVYVDVCCFGYMSKSFPQISRFS